MVNLSSILLPYAFGSILLSSGLGLEILSTDKAKLELVRQSESEAEQWLLPGVSSKLKPPLEKVKCRLENSRSLKALIFCRV